MSSQRQRCVRAAIVAGVLAALAACAARAPTVVAEPGSAVAPQLLALDCADCPQLLVVPAGGFVMGSDDGEADRSEGPRHAVRFSRAFALARTETTVAAFRRFIDATGYAVAPGCRVHELAASPRGHVEWQDDPGKGWREPGFVQPGGEDLPVVCVGRTDALAYVDWLRRSTGKPYRLPSEAEWEYAARAGSAGIYSWGSNADNGCAYANLYDRKAHALLEFAWGFADCDDGFAELAPVGSRKPNAWGLHDMLGNVWEWTADCYREAYVKARGDGSAEPPAADCRLWSVRGGGWMTRPSRQRLTFRGRDPNDARYNYFGFRVARDLAASDRR